VEVVEAWRLRLLGSSRTWGPVTDRLSPTFRCIAYDHRGWGHSKTTPPSFRITDLADDCLALIGVLGLQDYILVGHSMGGKVAQAVAARRPPGLQGLVLVAPSPAGGVHPPAEQLAAMRTSYDTRDSVLATLDHVLTHVPLSDELREQVVQDSLAGTSEAKHAWPDAALAEDVSALLETINVPVVVLAGENDLVDPVALITEHVVDQIPGATLHLVPDTGHLSPLETPHPIATAIHALADAQLHA
jgi:3-oxoadipate enol-lactonase